MMFLKNKNTTISYKDYTDNNITTITTTDNNNNVVDWCFMVIISVGLLLRGFVVCIVQEDAHTVAGFPLLFAFVLDFAKRRLGSHSSGLGSHTLQGVLTP